MPSVRILEAGDPRPGPGLLATRLVGHYVEHGTAPYLANTRHRVLLADVDGQVLPLVVNDGDDSRCYLTSPYVNYISYAEDFARSVKERAVRWGLLAFIRAVRAAIPRRHLDRVVYVNHWLLATGPELALSTPQLAALTEALQARFPEHAFVFKRASAATAEEVERGDSPSRLHAIFNRQMYRWRHEPGLKPPREFRQDRGLLQRHQPHLRRLTTAEPDTVSRLGALYRALYLDKYSELNAHFTPAWFEAALQQGALEVYGIDVEGGLHYFVTCFEAGDELIGSVVGHDPALSRKHGLYRAGVSHLMRLAEERGLTLNLSSGSGEFKRKRGCTPWTEYELLGFEHLPWRARHSWSLLRGIYNAVGPRVFTALSI
ncbi:GNAT family N-acetyltransferase [Corallococcus llansteffanensis]|uniref:GNAT family N-acetyltransferase n=1 Tax=Corallococcus llansteffanensis TaxID=2316731 RepID=A0A3A8QLZ1_9BACT|nr:GNAT family N-acetyltransferase [Corallococcus llansteffanensis]RKH65862.1 GNAT family N-acetyltransferase [Corallococcus llansteffanensis]